MKVSILLLGIGTVLEGIFVSGSVIHPRFNAPGVVTAPIGRRDRTRSVENDFVRREMLIRRATSGTVGLTLDNSPSKLLYYANSTDPPFLLSKIRADF